MANPDEATVVDLDYALLKRTARGEREAFAVLVRRHQDRVYRLARRLLRSPLEAEDAVQEVFLRAYQHAGRFQPSSTVAAWLNRITANYCLNRLRAQTVRQEVSWEGLEAEGWEPDRRAQEGRGGDDPWTVVAGKELAEVLQQALDGLPENQRQALILKRFGDLSYQEIGELLGISPGAVDGLLKRARLTLKGVVARYQRGED